MIQCMHSGCYRRSNVFITNNDTADLQTHDCCTRHDCARRLAEVEADLSEERDRAAEGWERARHLQSLLQAAERGESKQMLRAEAAEAEIEFMRAWSYDLYGVMPPTREQNTAFMRALDEMENDRG